MKFLTKKTCFRIASVTGVIFLLMAIITRFSFKDSPWPTDTLWMNFAYGSRSSFFDFIYGSIFANVFGDVGGVILVLILGLILWFFFKEQIGALWLVVSAALAIIINTLIKVIVGRVRPDVNRLAGFANESGKSFASGHSVCATIICACLFFILVHRLRSRRSKWILLIGLIILNLLVMYSRIYLGVHYPSDTFAGWLEAVTVVLLTYPYFKIAHNKEISGRRLFKK